MIEVEDIIAWSATERATNRAWTSSEIDVVANDLRRAVRFYSRVFGLLPAPGGWGDSLVVVPVTASTRLVIHDAQAVVRRRSRCVRRWAFVVNDLDLVRGLVWELGVTVARDSGAPDHIYRWSNSRSLYIRAHDNHEIELVELGRQELAAPPHLTARAS